MEMFISKVASTARFILGAGTNLIGNIKIAGQNSRIAIIDGKTYALTVVDYAHQETHSGNGYFFLYSALKDNAATIEMRIQTPDVIKWGHYELFIDTALAGTAEMWFDTTKTHVGGNAIVPINKDFNSSNISGLLVCHTPAGAQAGVSNLGPQYIGAAASGGRVSISGETGSRGEFILKQNTAYLIRVTSRADNNALNIILNGYEHTNRE